MKRLFALLLLISFLSINDAFAQKKGDEYWGGSVSGGIVTIFDSDSPAAIFALTAAPEYGQFFSDNWRFAIKFSLSNAQVLAFGATFEPRVAYYVKLADNMYYTPELMVGVGYFPLTAGAVVCAGADLFALEFRLKEKVALTMSIASLTYNCFLRGEDTTHDINLNLGAMPELGVRVYI